MLRTFWTFSWIFSWTSRFRTTWTVPQSLLNFFLAQRTHQTESRFLRPKACFWIRKNNVRFSFLADLKWNPREPVDSGKRAGRCSKAWEPKKPESRAKSLKAFWLCWFCDLCLKFSMQRALDLLNLVCKSKLLAWKFCRNFSNLWPSNDTSAVWQFLTIQSRARRKLAFINFLTSKLFWVKSEPTKNFKSKAPENYLNWSDK